MGNPLVELSAYGQSPWLDNISRELIASGQLQRLIDEDGLRGVTSNPAIFEKSITGSTAYDEEIEALAGEGKTAMEIYETLAIKDIQMGTDVMASVYKRTGGRDGFVSLEVSPYLANDTEATIQEARRLWATVNRRNVMIKVPATEAGIPAVRQLIGDGLNINVTLMFSYAVYEAVAEAYIAGLEDRAAAGGDLSHVNSVASFFISRIDTLVDRLLEERLKAATDDKMREKIRGLIGQVAIANAVVTYQRFKELFSSPRWQKLAARGAKTQRVLWASTSTKNPNYRDVIYVEELIGADTVNTMPDATLEAFRDHGRLRPALDTGLEGARKIMTAVAEAGISMDEVGTKLVEEGVQKFVEPFAKLLEGIEQKRLQPVTSK
jgi:transaldolase/glucose-6-phosphate isomerase